MPTEQASADASPSSMNMKVPMSAAAATAAMNEVVSDETARSAAARHQHGYRITVVSAGVSEQSTTKTLAQAVAQRAAEEIRRQGHDVLVQSIDVRDLAGDLAVASVNFTFSHALREALQMVASSDGLVVASPVMKASYSGLFKQFWDVMKVDALLNMPVVVAASGGSERHALVPDHAMRELFAFLRAIVVPTSLMATSANLHDAAIVEREMRAGQELAALIVANVRCTVLDAAAEAYQR